MDDTLLKNIIEMRNIFGFPIWAIKACLELNGCDRIKAFIDLMDIYNVAGDDVYKSVKRNEEKLKERIKQLCG